nr:MAG TPA: hypothetical protein [Caudoviricetes sp.]
MSLRPVRPPQTRSSRPNVRCSCKQKLNSSAHRTAS